MDHRAGVTATATSPSLSSETVQAEQAIFTSVRTPMGEGYRLIAMSPGITSEERAEITRRSPSHGSLCSSDPAASALSSYQLSSARQCVAWTRYAGREQTARGGQRVHTHLVVLEPTGFQSMACDPFRVHAAMREVLGDVPTVKTSPCLDCLPLCRVDGQSQTSVGVHRRELECACRVAAEALAHEFVLVVGAASPMETLRAVLAVLPRDFRHNLALSANLQYAAGRQIRLTCVDRNSPELQRTIQGQNVRVLDLACPPADITSAYADWFHFVLERHAQGRLAESIDLADSLEEPLDAAALSRIVAVSHDADRVESASQSVLEELVARYADRAPLHRLEGHLVRQLLSAAVRRASELQHHAGETCAPVRR